MTEETVEIKDNTSRFSRTTDEIFQQFKNSFLKIGDIGTSQKNKFINYVSDVFDVLPLVEEAGFKPRRVIIGISIPPALEIYFGRYKEVDLDHINQLYAKHNSKILKMILKPLIMANGFQGKFSTDDMVFAETGLMFTIPPRVIIKYLHKDIAHLTKLEALID